jgi:hypothetical protein
VAKVKKLVAKDKVTAKMTSDLAITKIESMTENDPEFLDKSEPCI